MRERAGSRPALAFEDARRGDVEKALKIVESNREQFADDGGVHHQVACAYVFATGSQESDEYTAEAVESLQKAIGLGREEPAQMTLDPDLESVRGGPVLKNSSAVRPSIRSRLWNRSVRDAENVLLIRLNPIEDDLTQLVCVRRIALTRIGLLSRPEILCE